VRLFVAVLPDLPALDALDRAVGPLRELPGAPRWTARGLWHVTLAFLGEVAEPRLARLSAALGEVAAGHAPLRLRIAGAGTYPPRGAPRVMYAELTGDLAALQQLARAVRRAARSVGIPVERRPYAPHLTLGRWRPTDVAEPRHAEVLAGHAGPEFAVAEFWLVRSRLGPLPQYERLESWQLGHRPPGAGSPG
jgi:2'-5' RNA ligase